MSSIESGSNWNTRLRLIRALLIVKKGFSVVAPHEDDHAVFHFRQKHVLLGLVEAVDLVDEEQGPTRLGGQERIRLGEHLAEVFHTTRDRADLTETAPALGGQ